jgi:HJR/Mrr/RecB family endonuclease
MLSTDFRGYDADLAKTINVERIPADWDNIPEEWKRGSLLRNPDSLKGGNGSIDLLKALDWYFRLKVDVPFQVRADTSDVNSPSGELPICRLERTGHEYALVVCSSFIRMWNDLVANDIWFRYRFAQDTQTRVISVALGVFVHIAKHEMANLPAKRKAPNPLTHPAWFQPESAGQIHNFNGDRDKTAAILTSGRYRIVNDAIWMWFIGSYCFSDTTRYDNTMLRERLNWFFEGEEARGMGIHREFPNLMNDTATRAHATKMALFINQCYYERGRDPLEWMLTLALMPSRVEALWRDQEGAAHLWMLVGFCQMRVLWRAFVQPEITTEEQQQAYERELSSLVANQVARRLSVDKESAAACTADTLRQVTSDISAEFLLNLLSQGGHKDFAEVMRGVVRAFEDFTLIASQSDNQQEKNLFRGLTAAVSDFRSRIIKLQPGLIASLHEITREYMEWITKHSNVIDSVAADAFERIVAEVMASNGYDVDITARVRGQSADVLAVQRREGGETRYLIECKRYSSDRRVGIAIVNQVLGALARARIQRPIHQAILVTSSSFTRDAKSEQAQLRNLDLELRDGDDVREWLRTYKFREDYGLWLADDALLG